MKKWSIIIISILAFIALSIRACNRHINKAKEERRNYVDQLNFSFSGEIDSVIIFSKNHGLLRFHPTLGSTDRAQEARLNTTLKYNSHLRFLYYKSREIEISIRTPRRFTRGDSICINSNKNQITVFRNGEKIAEDEILSSLSGRPF